MEIRDLRYFLAIVREGHLTRAARSLHVAQPTLSHALARLEEAAGASLLERPREGRPGLRLTPTGERLAERARRINAELHGFEDDQAELKGVLAGRLEIVSMQTLNSTLLPGPLAGFAKKNPRVTLSLRTLAAEEIPAELREGRADLGLLAGAPPVVLGELAMSDLGKEELVLVARRDSPLGRRRSLALADLEGEPLVLMLPGTFTHSIIVEACGKAGFEPKARLYLESGEAIREVVRSGFGSTILPLGYVTSKDPLLRAVRLTRPTPIRRVVAAWDKRVALSRSAKAFLELLRPSFGVE